MRIVYNSIGLIKSDVGYNLIMVNVINFNLMFFSRIGKVSHIKFHKKQFKYYIA